MGKVRIHITGDVIRDVSIFTCENEIQPQLREKGTIKLETRGGAYYSYAILNLLNDANTTDVSFGWKDSIFWKDAELSTNDNEKEKRPHLKECYLSWKKFDQDKKSKNKVWRIEQFLGYDASAQPFTLYEDHSQIPENTPDILIIDDANLGFRDIKSQKSWPEWVQNKQTEIVPKWVILKQSYPILSGDLWDNIHKQEYLRNRLIISTNMKDIREYPVRISEGLSWERTANDLIRELESSSYIKNLLDCQFLLIKMGVEGAMLVENAYDEENRSYWLVYDSESIENDWAHENEIKGQAVGFHSCLVASMVYHLAEGIKEISTEKSITRELSKIREKLITGIKCGLSACKTILVRCIDSRTLSPSFLLPLDCSCQEICNPSNGFYHDRISGKNINVEGLAIQVGKLGDKRALGKVPKAKIGKLMTADTLEIEGFRNIKKVIENYVKNSKEQKPLGIAVFGLPGSGKSFGVKQIAKGILGDEVPMLEYNLTQLDPDSNDLINAFHQIRDLVLAGQVPIIFWDEFDSQDHEWLQHFLVPLQDGIFQEGQITHPLGRSIFVFAGGVHHTFNKFNNPKDKEAFKKQKGPDFISRLKGFLNVLGPNIYPYVPDTAGKGYVDDCQYSLRRAILLRSLMKLKPDKYWDVDPGLLNALLMVDDYKHGARSMENLLNVLRISGGQNLKRSNLPTLDILEQFVNAEDFMDKLTAIEKHEHELLKGDEVPSRIHAYYRIKGEEEGWLKTELDKEFSEISEYYKRSNRAAAQRIPQILSMVGLQLSNDKKGAVSKDQWDRICDNYLEEMAEMEHRYWVSFMTMENWRYGKEKNESQKLNPCMTSFDDLPEKEKNKDRDSVKNYWEIIDGIDNVWIVKRAKEEEIK